jgi:hypothetical protein
MSSSNAALSPRKGLFRQTRVKQQVSRPGADAGELLDQYTRLRLAAVET